MISSLQILPTFKGKNEREREFKGKAQKKEWLCQRERLDRIPKRVWCACMRVCLGHGGNGLTG